MANLVVKEKVLARPLEPEIRMGSYHPPNISFIQFILVM
jgi:hypothetical protein